MEIVLVRIYVYGCDRPIPDGFTAFRDMAAAHEWLEAGNFKKMENLDRTWSNGRVYAECIDIEVV